MQFFEFDESKHRGILDKLQEIAGNKEVILLIK